MYSYQAVIPALHMEGDADKQCNGKNSSRKNPYPLFAQNSGYFFVIVLGTNLCTKIGWYGIIQSKYVCRTAANAPGKKEVWKGESLHV